MKFVFEKSNKKKRRGRKRKEENVYIAVVGCMTQQKHILDKIKESYHFVDIVLLGDGEENTPALIDLLKECKKNGSTKQEFLLKAKEIKGVYVPSLYQDSYNEDGTLKELKPINGAPANSTRYSRTDIKRLNHNTVE